MKKNKTSKRRNSWVRKLRPSARVTPIVTAQTWIDGKLVDDAKVQQA